MRLPLTSLVISETILIGLAQTDIIPSELVSIFVQLPLVGLFAWYVLYSNKQNREWLDHLLEIQDTRCQKTFELFERILERIDIRQNQVADRVELLTQQLSVNTSTVNESMRLHELMEELGRLTRES